MSNRTKLTLAMLGILLGTTGYYLLSKYNKQIMTDNTPQAMSAKRSLSPEAYNVMYEKGTETPFTSPLYTEQRKGTYVTADTGLPVYRSEDKYDSGTGWPSFVKPIEGNVKLQKDESLFVERTEVISADTGAHLGHVFDDGPRERGGKRYCMNGVALKFIPDEGQ